MLDIMEALDVESMERMRDVTVNVPGTAERVHCKLTRLGDNHYVVPTAESHARAMAHMLDIDPTKHHSNSVPMFKDIVSYVSEPTGRFFFTKDELRQLIKSGKYIFQIPAAHRKE